MKKKIIIAAAVIVGALVIAAVAVLVSSSNKDHSASPIDASSQTDTPSSHSIAYKPVIYLYPTEPTEVAVQLEYDGVLDFTYPHYNEGWSVTAYPDGRIINHADGREYSYLFWEGHSDNEYDLSKGFVVKGGDTAAFLQEKLAYMGLTPKEYNEFIVFWLPQLQNNEFNLISFQEEAYTDSARLKITPEPDSVLRVFMAAKPLDKPIDIPEQTLSPFYRDGFTVVEWGGTLVR